MNVFNEIQSLKKFRQFLPLLNAYNADNFRNCKRRIILKSVFYACCATVMVVSNIIWVILMAWYLFEHYVEWIKCVITVPLIATMIQFNIAFIMMMVQNRSITMTIDQIQTVINEREFRFFLISLSEILTLYSILFAFKITQDPGYRIIPITFLLMLKRNTNCSPQF